MQQQEGTGTGFIIDKTGFILTNNHVVEGADDIRVSLFGGGRTESYAAKVVGRDPLTDTALIQLSETPSAGLQEARFGDSAQMQPGDWVVAIGNPFNLSHTVTVGVISALGRPLGGVPGREQPMLQTDAAINPGNSGGPLLNVRGEVVGINTAIYTDSSRSANIGIGFATPINSIRDLLPQLRNGKVIRGVIGVEVSIDHLTAETAKAFGLSHSVSVGVISALGRPIGGVRGREQNMLQTDAAINPGNSGGPLLNVRGEVVGINTAIYTDAQRAANIGIGFATPINAIRDLLPQLRNGKVTRGVIGVEVRRDPVTKDEVPAFGLPSANGAVLSTVTPGQPAAKAGLEAGDVIVEFNGRPVADSDALVAMVVSTKPGTTVPVTIYRDKQKKTLNITIDELDLENEAGRITRRDDGTPEQTATGFGMDVGPITPEVARELELPRNRGGAIVTGVDRNSPAANAGVQPNDVILKVNGQTVANVSQVTRELQRATPGQPVFLLVWRDNQETFITMSKR